jgi:hypothetical protein
MNNEITQLSQRAAEVMSDLTAKPIIKNKFWIVEKDGNKVATIQTTDDGIVWVDGHAREKFATVKMLKDKHNVDFLPGKTKNEKPNDVYGYPVTGKFYNALYDVTRHLPIYTKQEKSRSFYCAGYYLIKLGSSWTRATCPKLITLQRYEFQGPFATEQEQLNRQEQLRNHDE